MSTMNLSDLLNAAKAEGLGGASEVLPDGPYNVEVRKAKPGASKNGKAQFSVLLGVVDGPYAGKTTWINQTLTPDNPASVRIFVSTLLALGVPEAAFAGEADPSQLAAHIAAGTTGSAKLSHHSYNGKSYQDLDSFTVTGFNQEATAAIPGITPVPPAAPVPVVAPVPVAPAAPAAPVPAPAAPVAPAPVAVVAPVAPQPGTAPATPF